jgi:hypothetical protein
MINAQLCDPKVCSFFQELKTKHRLMGGMAGVAQESPSSPKRD